MTTRRSTQPPSQPTDPRPARAPRPRKRFGQHFLSESWARRIVEAIDPQAGDVFLEIGPGRGALTMPLAESGAPILAVEIDRDLVAALAAQVPRTVTVMTGDVLVADVLPVLRGLEPQRPPEEAGTRGAGMRRRFRVVGNLPYNIASPIIAKLIDWHLRDRVFSDATVMLQKEMADRLIAAPGTKDYGVLTIMAGRHARIERLLDLPPAAFRPRPKVHSSVVRLTFGPPTVKVVDEALFERMVKAMFAQRRKTLVNALRPFDRTAPAVVALAGIDGRRRPETLDLQELARLADLFSSVHRSPVV